MTYSDFYIKLRFDGLCVYAVENYFPIWSVLSAILVYMLISYSYFIFVCVHIFKMVGEFVIKCLMEVKKRLQGNGMIRASSSTIYWN